MPYERNARSCPELAVKKVARSIKEFGFRNPILVDPEGIIIAGHTRLLAARQLKLREVPVIVVDLPPVKVRALRLADNRTAQETSWDYVLLNEELDALIACEYDPRNCGFDGDELSGYELPGTTPEKTHWSIHIECASAEEQLELLARFEEEGLRATAT